MTNHQSQSDALWLALLFFGLIAFLLAIVGCDSQSDAQRAMWNAYDARLDQIEATVFGKHLPDNGTDERAFEDIESRIEAAAVATWPVKIHAKDKNGEWIDICVYPEVLADGGFVVNVHTEEDKRNPDGTCWGTIIYPGQAVEQRPKN
jgi:hypothetical protein